MINLLPPEEKLVLKKEQSRKLAIVLVSEIIIFLICLILVLLSVKFYLMGELSSKTYTLAEQKTESLSHDFINLQYVISKYNQLLPIVSSFYNNQFLPDQALITLLKVERPNGLYFTNLSLNSDQPAAAKAIISGFSSTRDGLVAFKANLEKQPKIKNVNVSPESWISIKDVNFNISLDVVK
jgi:hypothetical protein